MEKTTWNYNLFGYSQQLWRLSRGFRLFLRLLESTTFEKSWLMTSEEGSTKDEDCAVDKCMLCCVIFLRMDSKINWYSDFFFWGGKDFHSPVPFYKVEVLNYKKLYLKVLSTTSSAASPDQSLLFFFMQ